MFLALMVPIRLLALIAKRENLHAIMINVLAVIFVHLSAQSMRLVWEKLYLKKEEQASLQTNIHLINTGSKNKETSQLRCLFSIYLTLSVCAILSNTKMRFNTVFLINTSPFYNVSLH